MTTTPAAHAGREDFGAPPRFADALREPGHDGVRAAAGTPHTVFPMAPGELVAHAGATVVDVRERTP